MKFYCFGKREDPVIMLFPGTCCHWKDNFGAVIPLLQECFHVICVSYDGFDETEKTIFPDMLTETKLIERYITEKQDGKIFAAYGCSLGGSFVGLLIQRGNIHIEHGIIGSSDLDESGVIATKLQASIVAPIMAKMLHTGVLPKFMQKRLDKQSDEDKAYTRKMLEMMGIGEKKDHISKNSIYNQFYSDLVTPLENDIHADGTMVHIFYALKMGDKYEERYKKHFRDPHIAAHDLRHEELLIRYPEKWVKEVEKCCFEMIKNDDI